VGRFMGFCVFVWGGFVLKKIDLVALRSIEPGS
jgi:hypothetical protein